MRSKVVAAVVVVGSGVFWPPTDADARRFRRSQIPNGAEFSCSTCHIPGASRDRNSFGRDVENSLTGRISTADVEWSLLYDLDSDGDGYTNGEELSDPEGLWISGPSPEFFGSNPGTFSSTPCGNDIAQFHEECDGSDLRGATCESLEESGPGRLSCAPDCTYDRESCQREAPPEQVTRDMGADAEPSADAGMADSARDTDMNFPGSTADMGQGDAESADGEAMDGFSSKSSPDEGCNVVLYRGSSERNHRMGFLGALLCFGCLRRGRRR